MGTDDSGSSRVDSRTPENETTTQADLSANTPKSEPISNQGDSSTANEESSSPNPRSDGSTQSVEDMLLEFDEQEGLIRDRSLLDPNYVVEEDRIVGRDEQLQEVTKMLR